MADVTFKDLASQGSVTVSDIAPVSNEGTDLAYKATMTMFKDLIDSEGIPFRSIVLDPGPLEVKNDAGAVVSSLTDAEMSARVVVTNEILPKSAFNGAIEIGNPVAIRLSGNSERVSYPNQSGIVSGSTGFNLSANNALYDIKPIVLEYESSGEYNPATGEFTPLETGIYSCSVSCAGVMNSPSGTVTEPYLYLYFDGLPVWNNYQLIFHWTSYPPSTDFDIGARFSTTAQLIAGTSYKAQIRPRCTGAHTGATYVGALGLSIMRIA